MNHENEKEKRKIKVAWYENNMSFVEPILYYLKKENVFDVKIFGDPASADEEIIEYQPDLVIFDYRMPNINGVQMFKLLKGKFSFVPVFFSIWANDHSTQLEILNETKVNKNAIFDKHMEPSSVPRKLYDYYVSEIDKEQ